MTVQTEFYNYQSNPDKLDPLSKKFSTCLKAPTAMRRFLEDLDFLYLGCHNDREIRSGVSWSTHAFGACPDMRYQNPGPGIEFVDTEMIPFLIENSKELGLQAIHHYYRALIWRPPGTSGRTKTSDGWKIQNVTSSGNMGKPWAFWLHLEFLPSKLATDIYPLLLELWKKNKGQSGLVTPTVEPVGPSIPPNVQPETSHTVQAEVTTIRRGSTGNAVVSLQTFLNGLQRENKKWVPLEEDGAFGPKTESQVLIFQEFFELNHVDGIVGPKTWEKILFVFLAA